MSRQSGTWGEAQAASYLRRCGYELLAHSYRCRFGEIDLVARKGRTVCFVEVKLRSNVQYGLPREAVTPRKQERLRKTALCYLSEHELDCPTRFDVAEIYTDGAGGPARIEYLENAF
ncbi:MAG: YraN family protein [Ruminococcaceae bacterium]|jgi:putative endonuclease|nr:YraN family protein [Oscillospiraceae bacterium]